MWRQELTLPYCTCLGGRIGRALCSSVWFGVSATGLHTALLMFNYAASKAKHTHIALLTPTYILSCLPSRRYTHKHTDTLNEAEEKCLSWTERERGNERAAVVIKQTSFSTNKKTGQVPVLWRICFLNSLLHLDSFEYHFLKDNPLI